ncbi:hypothetical protein HO173_008291 [Letharia columbiana]|uniref:DUF7730 domain-containing protein n=1 Tax=Letharia columbiana TaxID=112416 RepID=A0A8H6FRM6_9LECA|nr:uncharacterized protein HO173_008291 [Letharia columbiana]KAF6233359.1 hypothetical protein HO173_008291 [Letharia columbiana]
MAPSFLSLPPELRLQIYRYLLCHSSWIQARTFETPRWPIINRAQKLLPDCEREALRVFSLESAVLRTCRTVYSEAKPVLYGQNTFLYSCVASKFVTEYGMIGFLDKRLKHIQHLKLEIEDITWCGVSTAESVARAIQYFVERGCELGTFELILNQLWDRPGGYYEDRHHLLREIAASQEVMAALVELEVSKTLTVSIWFLHEAEASEHELQKSSADKIEDFVDRLASEKGMTATRIVIEDTKGDGAEDDSEGEYNRDDDWAFIPYKLSWCLRSQRSEQQSAEGASTSD